MSLRGWRTPGRRGCNQLRGASDATHGNGRIGPGISARKYARLREFSRVEIPSVSAEDPEAEFDVNVPEYEVDPIDNES